MTNYSRGADAEREVCKLLEGLGYYSARTAGSHGIWDVWAYHPNLGFRLIQVKNDTPISKEEMEVIQLEQVPPYSSKEVWTRIPNKPPDERWKVDLV